MYTLTIKLECMNRAVAIDVHGRWPVETVRRGRAIICIDITRQTLSDIMSHSGAYTDEMTDDDWAFIKDC